MAGKFDSLKNYLSQQTGHTISFSFKDIEHILGEKLCNSAYLYSAYWSRNRKYTCVSAIIDGGYKIEELDLQGQTIVLKKNNEL